MQMINLTNIENYYSNKLIKTFVLRQINLEIKEGEFITIMGPSGAGKSTLLYILGMLDKPSGGEYYFFDEPVHKMSDKKLTELHKSYIGFVFQQYHLIDELTVYENIETPLLYQKIKGGERKGLVADILDRFNMVAKKDLFPNNFPEVNSSW
jgi:putative ABC transport system ATP-binding protein